MTQEQLQSVTTLLLENIKQQSFVKGYQATDEEAMGMLLSKFFEWDGKKIMMSTHYALEDANFHPEASQLLKMAGQV